MPDPLEFGVVITAEDGRIERFLEKPSWGEVFSDTINTGIYVLEPEVLTDIPPDRHTTSPRSCSRPLLERGVPLYGWIADGYWKDIGNIAQFQEANRDALDGKVELEIAGVRLRDNVWLGAGSLAENIEQIAGSGGDRQLLRDRPECRGSARYTVLGNNVIVKEHCETEHCVVDVNTYLGPSSQIRGARDRQELRGPRPRSIARGRGDRGRVLDRRAGDDRLGRPHLPVQGGRDGRAGAPLARSGSRAAPRRCSPTRAWRES